MDRTARIDTAEALELLAGGRVDGDHVRDLVGWAVYTIEPPATVVACRSCRHLALIPSIPKVPKLTWTCSGCGHAWALEPPPAVWVAGSRPAVVRPT